MKKVFLIPFVIAFLSVMALSQKKQTDLEFEGIKGKVKSVQDSSLYLGTKDKPEKLPKRRYNNIEFYNLNGNITEELDSDHGVKFVYQFVDDYLTIKEIVIDQQKTANTVRARINGNAEDMEKPIKTIKPDEHFLTRFDDEYDNDGHRKLRRIFFSDGRMDSISLFSYNSAGLLEKEIYNSYGNKWTYFYSYDKDGKLKEKTMKRSNIENVINLIEQTEYSDYKFDAEGNWTERKYVYHSESNSSSTTSNGIDYRYIKYYSTKVSKKQRAK